MASVRARIWRFTIQTGTAGAEAVQAVEVGRGSLPVSLAALVNINALACDLRQTVDQRVRDHELSLLLSYIGNDSAVGALTADCPALDSSSGHIRRFVSECTGLGVMTAASQTIFGWKSGADELSSFDVLPARVLGTYAAKGVRPDLLYALPGGPVAGEARGRRRDVKKQMFPDGTGTADQKERLIKLAKWSVAHGDHDYFMSWVWLGTGGVYVDVFLPYDSPAARGLRTEWMEEPGGAQPWRFKVPPPDPRRRQNPAPDGSGVLHHRVPEPDTRGSHGIPKSRPTMAIRGAESLVDAAMDRAFSRDEDVIGTLAGVPVRGTWIRGDAIGGPARHEVLIGILRERVPLDRQAQRRRLTGLPTNRLDMFLQGRLLTVVKPVDNQRPDWSRITEELLA